MAPPRTPVSRPYICQFGLAEFLSRLPGLHLPYHAVLLFALKLLDNTVVLQLKVLIAVDKLSDHNIAVFISALELDVAGLEGLRLDAGHDDTKDKLHRCVANRFDPQDEAKVWKEYPET